MTTKQKEPSSAPKLDWFQATINDEPVKLISIIVDAFSANLDYKNGRNGYAKTAVVSFDDNVIEIYHGGNNGADPNLKASGHISGTVRELIQSIYPDRHKVSRIDTALDLYSADFDAIHSRLKPIAEKARVKEQVIGDWFTDGSPEGRTVYYGSKSSSARLRIYEKGKEQRNRLLRARLSKEVVEQIPESWVRFEAQIRPTKNQKAKAAIASPAELFGFAMFITEMYEAITGEDVEFIPILPREPSDVDKAFIFMCDQYKRVLRAKAAENGGYEALGLLIAEFVAEF